MGELIISSRTPEGVPNRCPLCDADICIEPSQPAGDAPCPRCGTLLWFIKTLEGARYYDYEIIAPWQEKIRKMLCENLGVNKSALSDMAELGKEIEFDSLDLAEFLLEIEEEFDVHFPADAAEEIRTWADLIEYLALHARQRTPG